MRILSWNINGIRTLPQYHPWNSFKSCEGILNELGADIICFQEMKSSRTGLPRDVAISPMYSSFFSFPLTKGGYSGVAVYTKSASVLPRKAEEGLSGKLQSTSQLTLDERISTSYPDVDDIEAFPNEEGLTPSTFDALDSEGRALIVDFGLFVLINVYCPNETSDARLPFKMNYHLLLQERVRKLVEEEHREVIVLGDLNICATPLDHCDGHLPSNAATFYEHPARAWFHKWLAPNGLMVDVVRSFWLERKGLYTCWNTKISARETNYGTRVDYILVTPGLLKWIKYGDIQPSLKGSDHCPIYIDLHDELVEESGNVIYLRDILYPRNETIPLPRIAAANWEEFSGKQKLLSSFFGRKADTEAPPTNACSSSQLEPGTSQPLRAARGPKFSPSASTLCASLSNPSLSKKRTSAHAAVSPKGTVQPSKKRKKTENDQGTLSTFFVKPKAPNIQPSSEIIEMDEYTEPSAGPSSSSLNEPNGLSSQLEADYQLALELSQEIATEQPPSQGSSSSKEAWSNLFTPVKPPKCIVHGEFTKKYTVNKQGPNKGRSFYLCSRPVGPGYDKGKSERLRDEVDHRYRCNYFKWASDLKREPSSSSTVK